MFAVVRHSVSLSKRTLRFNRSFSTSNPLYDRVLILAEHDNQILASNTLNTATAASKLGDVDILVAGKDCKAVAESAGKIANIQKVFLVDADHLRDPVAEDLTEIALAKHNDSNYDYIIAPSSAWGKNVLPRLGAKLDSQPISDIIEIKDGSTFVRPIYAGNALATVKSKDKVKLITVRTTSFDKAEENGSAEIETFEAPASTNKSAFVSREIQKSERPDLGSASVVVSGGRALKNSENFEILYKLADKLGGAVGASRAAVDAGYAPNDLQVGQTGKIVAPELYIACGISGAIQHLAGMKDSKVIVAINTDSDAPIFQVADYGLVQDLFTAVPEITNKLK